jgi:hypothetical protein
MKSLHYGFLGFMIFAGAQDLAFAETTISQSLEVLGIEDKDRQSGFLELLNASGNLEAKKLWVATYKIFKFKGEFGPDGDKNIKNELAIFNSVKQCFSFEDNQKILDCKIDNWTDTDLAKLFVWLSQNAFNRVANQERYQMANKQESKEVLEKFLTSAKKFGLVDEIQPKLMEYDYAIITGASTEAMLSRIAACKHYENLGKIKAKNTVILAGGREAWVEIDKVKEGALAVCDSISKSQVDIEKLIEFRRNSDEKDYNNDFLIHLAEENGIKLKEPKLIKYSTQQDCPNGKFANRTYLNYDDSEDKKVTESTIAKYLFNRYLSEGTKVAADIIDTKSEKDGFRPTTESTARDFATKIINFLESIPADKLPSEINFAVVSNQPYAIRQKISINLEINKALKASKFGDIKINVDAVSYKLPYFSELQYFSKSSFESEVAATLAEYFKDSQYNGYIDPQVDLKELLFQTRDNSEPIYYPTDIMGENQ